MRFIVLFMLLSSVISTMSHAQQWQNVVTLDSRVGYSTNTYLNPFLAEWDPGIESAYNLSSATIQSYWYKNDHSVSFTGGFLYEPIFREDQSWKGGLGVANYNYRFSSNLSAGVEAGASYFSSSYSRRIFWVQPKVTWFVSPFTLFRFKTGSSFRGYTDYPNEGTSNNRFDVYSLELETWPDYRWQFTAGLYGSLNTLPSIQEGFNARTSVGYYLSNGAEVGLNIGLEQYQIEVTEQGGGGPPIGGPANQPAGTTQNTDRIFRIGIDGSLPINKQFSVFTSAEMLRFKSESSDITISDYELSGGIRFSFEPKVVGSSKVTPEWEVRRDKQEIKVRFPAEGRLYLVGEFNNWDKTGIPLRKQSDNTYVAQFTLSPGAYEYKLLHKQGDTEEWVPFSNETYTVSDGYGSENAILLVQ